MADTGHDVETLEEIALPNSAFLKGHTPRQYMELKGLIAKAVERISDPLGFPGFFLNPAVSPATRRIAHCVAGLYGWKHASQGKGGYRFVTLSPPVVESARGAMEPREASDAKEIKEG